MSQNPLALNRLGVPTALPRRRSRLRRMRVTLGDRALTTLHIASFDRAEYRMRAVQLETTMPLAQWCNENGAGNAIVGGFFVRPSYQPLGELRVDGRRRSVVPFDSPWGSVRACVHVDGAQLTIARRHEIAAHPRGDLLQAGPLLVSGGEVVLSDGDDSEGFSAGAHQFDSDITRGRYPRAALGISETRLLAVACDGRTPRDAGLTLGELAWVLRSLGASHALNLDGGGSASLVYGGRLRNRPREEHGIDLLNGRPVTTALVFEAP